MRKMEQMINNIITGDCIEKMRDIDDGSIDLIITSPPYNFNIKYDRYRGNKTIQEYKDFLIK